MYSFSTPSSTPNDETMTCRLKTAVKRPTPHNTNAETEEPSPPTHHAVWSLPGQVRSSESSHTGLGQQWNPAALQPPCHWKDKFLDSMLSDPTQWYFYRFCLDPLASGVVPKLPYMHVVAAPTMPSFSKFLEPFHPFYLMSPSFSWEVQTLPSFLYFPKITSHRYTIHQLKSMHSSPPMVHPLRLPMKSFQTSSQHIPTWLDAQVASQQIKGGDLNGAGHGGGGERGKPQGKG